MSFLLFLPFLIPSSNFSLPFSYLFTKKTALLPLLQLQNVLQMHSKTNSATSWLLGSQRNYFSYGIHVVQA